MAFTQGTQKLWGGNISRNKPLQLCLQSAGSSHMSFALLPHKQKRRSIIRRIGIKGFQASYKDQLNNCPQPARNREAQEFPAPLTPLFLQVNNTSGERSPLCLTQTSSFEIVTTSIWVNVELHQQNDSSVAASCPAPRHTA